MEGGTTFSFVTDGVESAVEQARAAAGDGDVSIAGGAEAVQQALAAGLVDEVHLFVFPVAVGGGTPALAIDGHVGLELVDERRFTSGVVYLGYRVTG